MRRKLLKSLCLCVALLGSGAAAQEAVGYKVNSGAALRISVDRGQAVLDLALRTQGDCVGLVSGVPEAEALCAQLAPRAAAEAPRVEARLTGAARATSDGFEADLHLPGVRLLPVQMLVRGGRVVILQVVNPDRPANAILTTHTQTAYAERLAALGGEAPPAPGAQTRIARRSGNSTEAVMQITRAGSGREVVFTLDAKVAQVGFDAAVADCYPTLSPRDPAWIRQCEKATKDGTAVEMRGTLRPVPGEVALFEGVVQDSAGGWRWRMRLATPDSTKLAVALAADDSRGFDAAHEYLLFAAAVGEGPGTSGQVNLTAFDWRIPQERLPELGLDMELAFATMPGGYRATGIAWFRAEGEQITGYCPQSRAMDALCERVQKDGPLSFELTLDEAAPNAAFGYLGTFFAPDWGQGGRAFAADVFQGSSIPDWGDEIASVLYLRLRHPDAQPGAEAVAWLPLEPMTRARVTPEDLAARGTFGQPPVAPPAPLPDDPSPVPMPVLGPCNDLKAALDGAGNRDAMRAVLDRQGLPSDPTGQEVFRCEEALQTLAEAGLIEGPGFSDASQDDSAVASLGEDIGAHWPAPGEGLAFDTVGADGERLWFFGQHGRAYLHVPPIVTCLLTYRDLCTALMAAPGDHAVTIMAKDRHSMGLVQIGDTPFVILMIRSDPAKVGANGSQWSAQILPYSQRSGLMTLGASE